MASPRLLRLDLRVLQRFAEEREVLLDERGEFLGRAADGPQPRIVEDLLYLRRAQDRRDLLLYAHDALARRAGREPHSLPSRHVDAGIARLRERGNIRKTRRANLAREGDRTHAARLDLRRDLR